MNSRQRRNQRVFEHEVTLVCNDLRYFEFEHRLDRAKQWLQWSSKRKNYTMGPRLYNKQTFKFRTGGLASVFALKFV